MRREIFYQKDRGGDMKQKLIFGICAACLLVLSGCDMSGIEDGVLTENDYTAAQTSEGETESEENSPYWEVEISPGYTLSFDISLSEEQAGEIFDTYVFEIAVFIPGEETPFQILEAESTELHPFSLEDFNADGYQDLRVEFYYGANGGSAAHYLWSPSRGEFVEGPKELEYYGQYGIDYEKRQLFLHCHGSAISGSESIYQWSGEMDCELIRYFEHGEIYDFEQHEDKGVQVDIYRYEDGQIQVLSEYRYPTEEYLSRDDIWGIFDLDFVWEQEVALEGQERPCILRYTQETDGSDWLDYLFLFREDTYLICALEKQKAPAAYTDIVWEEETQRLAVHYEDGTTKRYRWNGEEFAPETGE